MLRHEAMPALVHLANEGMKMKDEIRMMHGLSWKSKQRLLASSLSLEETEKIVFAFGEKL
jgi:hypothetical protein